MERLNWFLLLSLAALAVACPATTKLVLWNDSPAEIEVLSAYSDAVLARIAPSTSETVIYNQDCFRIRKGSETLEFQPAIPPDRYVEVRTFNVRISATFTRDNELEITPLGDQIGTDPNISMKRGCPLRPKATQ